MPIGGAFLGGVSERTPAGKTTIILQAVTEDNQHLSTASWVITATGRRYEVSAGADGRAEQLVDAGYTYTVTPSITGTYDGLTPQTVHADSTEVVLCEFDLTIPRVKTSVANSTFATKTELSNGLAEKQDTGDYATRTELNTGLATKQPTGDYAKNPDTVHKAGAETITGTKTFSVQPVIPATPEGARGVEIVTAGLL